MVATAAASDNASPPNVVKKKTSSWNSCITSRWQRPSSNSQVGRYPEIFLRPADGDPETSPHLVEDEERTIGGTQCLQLLQEVIFRRLEHKRFQDHTRNVLIECVAYGIQIVIVERRTQVLYGIRNSSTPAGNPSVPIMPTMIPATQHLVPAGKSPCHPHRGTRHIRTRFADADTLGIRDDFMDQLGQRNLQLMHHRERDAVFQLRDDRVVDPLIGIAERQGTDPHI